MISINSALFFAPVRLPHPVCSWPSHPRPPRRPVNKKKRQIMDPLKEGEDSSLEVMAGSSSKSSNDGNISNATRPKKRPYNQTNNNGKPFNSNKRRKTRIHPSEAHHRIDDLPTFESKIDDLQSDSAAEKTADLGLAVSGKGKGVKVWFVGYKEGRELGSEAK